VPGVEQVNVPATANDNFVQKHVWLDFVGLSVATRPAGITSGAVHANSRMISFPMGSSQPEKVNGRTLQRPYFWVATRGDDVDLVEPSPWTTSNIVFARGGELLDDFRDADVLSVYEVGGHLLRPLRDLAARVTLEGPQDSALLTEPSSANLVRDSVLMLLGDLAAKVREQNLSTLSFGGAQHTVRLVDEYVREVGASRVRLEELTRVVSCSLRTIQASFVAVKSMSLSHYLLSLRLLGARRALQSAAPGTQVKAVALEHGFWHLGRFAARYFERFGELPSDTLHNCLGSNR
jgi:AraC-like DNA-binding protein